MKLFVAMLSLIAALMFASCTKGQRKPEGRSAATHNKAVATGFAKAAEPSKAPRRLESITWDSVKHELTWEVSKGDDVKSGDPKGGDAKNADSYKPVAKDRYQIDMDNATMTFNGQTRRFSETEALNVRTLMDVIARYAVESTIWWEDGQGEPLDENGKPVNPPKSREKPKAVGAPSQIVKLTGALEQLATVMTPPIAASELR